MSKTDGSEATVAGHTPLPWVAGNNDGYSIWTIWSGCHPSGGGPTGKLIAEVVGDSAETDANAALIVRAVNRDSQFADMVGALEEAREYIGRENNPKSASVLNKILAALHGIDLNNLPAIPTAGPST